MTTHADLFATLPVIQPPRPAHYGGNKIPDSYLDRFNSRGRALRTMPDPPDDFAEMPWQLQRFVRSICAMHSYDPTPAPPPKLENDDDDDQE